MQKTFPIRRSGIVKPFSLRKTVPLDEQECLVLWTGITEYEVFDQLPKDLRDALNTYGMEAFQAGRYICEGHTVEAIIDALEQLAEKRQRLHQEGRWLKDGVVRL